MVLTQCDTIYIYREAVVKKNVDWQIKFSASFARGLHTAARKVTFGIFLPRSLSVGQSTCSSGVHIQPPAIRFTNNLVQKEPLYKYPCDDGPFFRGRWKKKTCSQELPERQDKGQQKTQQHHRRTACKDDYRHLAVRSESCILRCAWRRLSSAANLNISFSSSYE